MTVLAAVLAITVFIGGLSIYEVDQFVQLQTKNYITAISEKEALHFNDIFSGMEKSVRIMESYVLSGIETPSDIGDADKQKEIVERIDEMFANVAKNTNSAVAYYVRFSHEISDNRTGLFYSKPEGETEYVCFEVTDLGLYDREDTEHVGWYWQPYEAKKPVWMKPYYNQNNNILMISYVVPMYLDDQFIGVVGMDFDYTVLTDKVHEIRIYENGYAHLEMDGAYMYLSDHEQDAEVCDVSQDYLQVSTELVNGMSLVLSASYEDIWQIRYEIAFKIVTAAFFLGALFSLAVVFIVRKIVEPLEKLTDASKKLSDGDYDVEIVDSDTYEIKLLSTAFENMSVRLREHAKLQHLLAYRDSMTGLRNTTAYKSWVTDFDKEIQGKDFGVIVLDLNYLKDTNDRYGHDMGNRLIVTAAKIIADTFKRSPVFRIGGDEFVVILQNRDLEEREALFARFDLECATRTVQSDGQNVMISIAKGFARFNPEKDTQIVDVFNRADEAMYQNKKEIKAAQMQKSCR